MRYIIRPNATPAGTGMVQLWIDAGSVAETDDQQGYAHFIEHMAFNGSTHVPEGDMVKLLEREGLAFGADTNAATDFDSTVYKLDLPRNDPKLLDSALMLMRETASELSFTPEAVEREKGVVLSERRVRDTYDYRNTLDDLAFLYPGARFAERLPIGTLESIQHATPEGLRAFWSREYRPGNAAIIVVGDFDPGPRGSQDPRALHRLARRRVRCPSPSSVARLTTALADKSDVFVDPALSERVTVSRSAAHGSPRPIPSPAAASGCCARSAMPSSIAGCCG